MSETGSSVEWRNMSAEHTSATILVRACHVRGGASPLQDSLSSKLPLGRYSYTSAQVSGHAPIRVTRLACLNLLSTLIC